MSKYQLRDRVKRADREEVRTVQQIREIPGVENLYWVQLGNDTATSEWAKESELELADLGSFPMMVRCSKCSNLPQGPSMPLGLLLRMLENHEGISVMGSQCGHVWPLSEVETVNLRREVLKPT